MRRATLRVEPLTDWPYPDVPLVPSPFDSTWVKTRYELLREADHLGADQVVLEVDCSRRHLRQDGELRADARLHSGRVRVSMDTRHGPMRWALARYEDAGLSWQANVRGIVLTLAALRAVDRYGAVADGQQYQGFLAIESGAPNPPLVDLDTAAGARRWLEVLVGGDAHEDSTGSLLRTARRVATGVELDDLARVERTLTGAGSVSS